MELAQIKAALNTQQSAQTISVQQVQALLKNVKSTTFATITQCSKVKTSAKHKAQNIYKITVQNVTLCNSAASLYNNAVNKQLDDTQQFTAQQSNYVMLNNSYSIVALKSNTAKHYLRCIVNKCLSSVYYCANTQQILSKQQVAQYLTASAVKQLLHANSVNTVKHANIQHTITARTFALANITSIVACKQQLAA